MAYIDLASMKAVLGIAVSKETDDTLIQQYIDSAQTIIENYCNHYFEARTATRYYRESDLMTMPTGSQYRPMWRTGSGYSWDNTYGYGNVSEGYYNKVLWLGEDCLTVTTLTNADGNEIVAANYWLEPRNEAPYQFIRLKTAAQWVFDTDGEISVAGTWGYSSTAPADIVQAMREYVAYLYRSKDSQVFDTIANPEAGVITVPVGVPKHVRKILRDGGYVREIRIV